MPPAPDLDLLKGTLDVLVLKTLSWRSRHGYAVARWIAETTDDYPRSIETPPEVRHWEELMWRFQRPLPHAAPGEKWISMKRIFDLEEQ